MGYTILKKGDKPMISAFGIASVLVLALSIYAMILHFKLMKKRTAMDESLAELEFLLHEQLESIEDPEIENLKKLYKSMQKTESITPEIKEAMRSANHTIKAYNAHISVYPAKAMAFILGFSAEKKL